MTRKDFELIARTINAMPYGASRDMAAHAFANALTGTNSNFDRLRFLKACGVPLGPDVADFARRA